MTAAPRGILPWLLPALGGVVAAGTIAWGLIRDGRGERLGVPHPPILGAYGPEVHPLAAVAAVVLALAVALAPRLMRATPARFVLATLALGLAGRLAVAAARSGTGEWTAVFDLSLGFEAKNEYLPGLGSLTYGVGFFLDRFAELVPSQPVHVAGHPPGLLLTMHLLGLDTAGRLAAFCIGVGTLSIPLTYALGRAVTAEATARVATLLFVLAPGALLFTATSPDAVYMTLGLAAAVPLAMPGLRARAAGAVVLALGSFFAWSLLAVGAWAAILALRREGLRAAFMLSVVCGVALLVFHAAVHALTGFDPIGTIRATEGVYRAGIAAIRPYEFWVLGSPVAFLVVLGLPISALALRAVGCGTGPALAIAAVILTASVLGFTKAETERIWLFLAPFVCLAAAMALPRRALVPVLALLAIQALAFQLVFYTVW